jgi:hypothetical protein
MRPASRRFSLRFLYAGRAKVKSKPQKEVENIVPAFFLYNRSSSLPFFANRFNNLPHGWQDISTELHSAPRSGRVWEIARQGCAERRRGACGAARNVEWVSGECKR